LIKTQTRKQNSQWLKAYASRSKGWLFLSTGLGLASGVLMILQAGVLAHMISQLAMMRFVAMPSLDFCTVFLLLVAIRAGLAWGREVAGFRAAASVKTTVRHALMAHCFKMTPEARAQVRSGAMASAALEQVEGLHGFFASYLPQMKLAVFIPLAILVFVFPLNWVSGVVLLITAPLIPLFMALVGMGAEKVNQKHFQSLARLSAHFLDVIQGLTTLKLFGRSREQVTTIKAHADEYAEKTMSVLKIAFLSSATLEMFSSAAIALIAVYLGFVLLGHVHLGAAHGITLQYALFILLLAPEFYLPLRQLAAQYHARAEALAAAAEIRVVLETERVASRVGDRAALDPVVKPRDDFARVKPRDDFARVKARDDFVRVIPRLDRGIHITFEKATFAYKDTPPIIRDVDLTITQGECIAIVGASGTGKSTLLNLILGWLQPSAGSVLVNGVAIQAMDQVTWLTAIAWIAQNTRLFPGTIRENILFSRPTATANDLQAAVSAAYLDAWIATLPNGLDTPIGEDNFGVSGGQAQRIALARAYLKDAPLLLLDEPTASLDADSEKMVLASLRKFSQSRTVIIVSHRKETVNFADKVYQLDGGKLVPVMASQKEAVCE
jgi:ATP-binding cassette, subfamily C, bacterial CydD